MFDSSFFNFNEEIKKNRKEWIFFKNNMNFEFVSNLFFLINPPNNFFSTYLADFLRKAF